MLTGGRLPKGSAPPHAHPKPSYCAPHPRPGDHCSLLIHFSLRSLTRCSAGPRVTLTRRSSSPCEQLYRPTTASLVSAVQPPCSRGVGLPLTSCLGPSPKPPSPSPHHSVWMWPFSPGPRAHPKSGWKAPEDSSYPHVTLATSESHLARGCRGADSLSWRTTAHCLEELDWCVLPGQRGCS